MVGALVPRRYARYALYVLGGAVLFFLFRAEGGPTHGQAAPSFDLPVVNVDGHPAQRIGSASHSGKPLLIEVFASWCGTCQRAAPTLSRAHRRYGDDLQFLGVSLDDTVAAAASAKQQWAIPYPVLHDADGEFARAYRIRVLPTFVLVDATGRIAAVSSGLPSATTLEQWAQSVLQ